MPNVIYLIILKLYMWGSTKIIPAKICLTRTFREIPYGTTVTIVISTGINTVIISTGTILITLLPI